MGDDEETLAEIEELMGRLEYQDIEAVGLAGAITLATVAIMTWFRYTRGWVCAGGNRTNVPSRS